MSAGAVCDVNDDGVVDQTDHDIIYDYCYNPSLSSYTVEQLDTNGDGKVTNTDTLVVDRYMAGVYQCEKYGHTNENLICGCGYTFEGYVPPSGCRHSWVNDFGFCKSCGERVRSANIRMTFLSALLPVVLIASIAAVILHRKKKRKV